MSTGITFIFYAPLLEMGTAKQQRHALTATSFLKSHTKCCRGMLKNTPNDVNDNTDVTLMQEQILAKETNQKQVF